MTQQGISLYFNRVANCRGLGLNFSDLHAADACFLVHSAHADSFFSTSLVFGMGLALFAFARRLLVIASRRDSTALEARSRELQEN